MKILFLLSLTVTFNAYSFNDTSSELLPIKKRYTVENLEELALSERTQRLIGNMTLAVQSIDFGLKHSALYHVELARKEAGKLLTETKMKAAPMTYPMAKLSSELGGGSTNYYVPVWYSEGITEEVEESSARKWPQVEIVDTKVVLTSVQLDVSNAIKSLDAALKNLEENDLSGARKNVDKIFQSALVTESVIIDPIMTVWSNLELAKEFMNQNNFKSARFTMKKAQQGLKGLQKKKFISTKSQDIEQLEKELNALTQDLNTKAPGFFLRAKTRLKAWAKKVKEWV